MISYNNSNVVQCLRQYDMFANSINLVKTKEEKNMIIKQLTKLELKIIELTNEVYEEEYNALISRECGLIEEERDRLSNLIELINQRLTYIERRVNNHYQLTGESLAIEDVLGSSQLEELEERIKIIDKYSNNVKLESDLKKDLDIINSKIALANEKININKSLNIELEKKFIEVLSDAFMKCGFYKYIEEYDRIEYAYYECDKALTIAEINLETAKVNNSNMIDECIKMRDEIKNDYFKYKEKINIVKLLDLYKKEVKDYDELLIKRKEINELFRYIKNQDFLDCVHNTITNQYNTIIAEQNDNNTFDTLLKDKDNKIEVLKEIDRENNSEAFQVVLQELIKNEQVRQEKLNEEKRRLEEIEKKKRFELERRKQEEILKRQKIIEEARKKEMEKRTKQLLEQQQKSVLQVKKKEVEREDTKEEEKPIIVEKNDDYKETLYVEEETPTYKNKDEIEEDLFKEFNSNSKQEFKFNDSQIDEILESTGNKLPKGSLDDYMKNYKHDDRRELEDLLDDGFFPNIPL